MDINQLNEFCVYNHYRRAARLCAEEIKTGRRRRKIEANGTREQKFATTTNRRAAADCTDWKANGKFSYLVLNTYTHTLSRGCVSSSDSSVPDATHTRPSVEETERWRAPSEMWAWSSINVVIHSIYRDEIFSIQYLERWCDVCSIAGVPDRNLQCQSRPVQPVAVDRWELDQLMFLLPQSIVEGKMAPVLGQTCGPTPAQLEKNKQLLGCRKSSLLRTRPTPRCLCPAVCVILVISRRFSPLSRWAFSLRLLATWYLLCTPLWLLFDKSPLFFFVYFPRVLRTSRHDILNSPARVVNQFRPGSRRNGIEFVGGRGCAPHLDRLFVRLTCPLFSREEIVLDGYSISVERFPFFDRNQSEKKRQMKQ